MQTASELILRQEYQRKVNECIENLQNAVEMSFINIDAQLDELLNNQSNNIIECQLQYDLPKINLNCLHNLQNENLPKQICQQMSSLIQNNTFNQMKKKQKQYEQEIKETQIKFESIIQSKDNQIQQFTKSQSIIQQPSTLISTQLNFKPFTYQLIKHNSIQQNEECRAIAVNQNCSIMVATCNCQIKVFEFNQGIFKQVSILSEHSNNVYTLNFMKKSDKFISGSGDNTIIIWTRNQNNQWICQQKLNGHTSDIYCLILNNNEDLIVTGSNDKTIKFWQKQNEWLCSQTITDHTQYVGGLSFNEQQNKLISCGIDRFILVIEQSQLNKQWMVIQKIILEQCGLRLSFIDDNTFTFQPLYKEQMQVFEMNSTNKQYTKMKDILVKGGMDLWLFPKQYIKQKCILINKNASNVNLIRKKQNGDYIVEQSIEFGTRGIFGCLTDDGQYLITWDDKSKEYQIRKYEEQ